ncbi:MAG: SMC-Scp complex subunit ScpB [Tissierellales bacterium]|nr:SMC-Scp complex subunit ScpB [Tissierellales bacterium]MBN2826901.1 SMC-Scp complex subunit ScpB [Tissierellales bacterium]
MNESKLKSIIESILFAWGDPLDIREISKILNIKDSLTYTLLTEMSQAYLSEDRGLVLKKFDDCYQLKTKDDNFFYVSELFKPNTRTSLSNAALEALSIIAYKQPVTKIEIDLIRGVKSDYIVKSLMDRNLIEIIGKLDKPGRPVLYGTTGNFLTHFGLASLKDLPELVLDEEKIINKVSGGDEH